MELNGIDNILKEKGLTRQDLADRLNVTASGLGRYIRGEREAPYEILRDMCRYLGLTADYVLGLSDTIAHEEKPLPDDERQLLERYKRLSDDGKEILRAEALKMIKEYPDKAQSKKAV